MESTIRTDMDQIITSKEHLASKIRGTALREDAWTWVCVAVSADSCSCSITTVSPRCGCSWGAGWLLPARPGEPWGDASHHSGQGARLHWHCPRRWGTRWAVTPPSGQWGRNEFNTEPGPLARTPCIVLRVWETSPGGSGERDRSRSLGWVYGLICRAGGADEEPHHALPLLSAQHSSSPKRRSASVIMSSPTSPPSWKP